MRICKRGTLRQVGAPESSAAVRPLTQFILEEEEEEGYSYKSFDDCLLAIMPIVHTTSAVYDVVKSPK